MHTPGPWIMRECYHHGEPQGAVVASGAYQVAECRQDGLGQGEILANARLIAVAPELLAVCKAMLELLGQWPWVTDDCQPVNPCSDWRQRRDPVWENARDVVAQAEGRDTCG
jgi:hypothetical protein